MTNPEIRSKGLHHVAFATREPEATYQFYTVKLGMPLVHTENHRQGEGWFRHIFFDMGSGDYLAFFIVNEVGEKPDYSTSISMGQGLPVWVNHIAFRLDSLEELDTMESRMRSHEVEHLNRIDHGWCVSLYSVDPNGIMVEFCVTTDAEQFAQSEEEALRLLRLAPDEFTEQTRKETSVAERR